jgi:mono/diheme cytochrome c family protein
MPRISRCVSRCAAKSVKVSATLVLALIAASNACAAAAANHFANADDPRLVGVGGAIYAMACSSCHGRRLEGQALWQVMDRYAGRRAPPHDATGHTWQHSDEALFYKTRFGRFPGAPPQAVSYMPAFAERMTDKDILAVLAFIKSSWPVGIRASQAMLNPGREGMPKNVGEVSWTLPPNCSSGGSFLRWSFSRR